MTYAHQHLVVHRDIKPLNILVTAEGVPKLLDFGIAKVLHESADDASSTVTGMRLLTPEYASPEQVGAARDHRERRVRARRGALRAAHRRSPYRPRSRAPLDVAQPSGRRIRCGRAPPGAPRARRRLRGDLDTILLTALRKEPARRYASVEQFADDIRRHLDGLPVRARPDTSGTAPASSCGGTVAAWRRRRSSLALIGGTVATAWQAREARAAQARAERRFNDVRRLANALLFDYHDAIKDLRGRGRCASGWSTTRWVPDRLAAEAHGDPALQRELAGAYSGWATSRAKRLIPRVRRPRGCGPELHQGTGAARSPCWEWTAPTRASGGTRPPRTSRWAGSSGNAATSPPAWSTPGALLAPLDPLLRRHPRIPACGCS